MAKVSGWKPQPREMHIIFYFFKILVLGHSVKRTYTEM